MQYSYYSNKILGRVCRSFLKGLVQLSRRSSNMLQAESRQYVSGVSGSCFAVLFGASSK